MNRRALPSTGPKAPEVYRPLGQQGYQPSGPTTPPQPPRGGTAVVDSPTARPTGICTPLELVKEQAP